MAHVDGLVAQAQLNFGGQLQQSQKVGNGGSLFADTFAQTFLGEVILVDKFLERECNLYCVEVLALDVLDESHFGELAVVGCANICRNRVEPGAFCSAITAFARYNLI